jgi:hypothetical protein
MITPSHNNGQHRSEHGWGGDPMLAAVCRAHTSAAHDKAQSGAHGRPVGVCRSLRGLTQFLPVRTGRGLTRSGLLSHSHCARSIPSAAAHRPLVRAPGGRAATLKFSRRLTKSRAHQLRISRKPGSDRADPLHRSTPLYIVGFNTDEHKRETTWNGPLPDKNSPRRTRSAPA